ncbi:MAG: acyl-CoA synthetase [Pseudomonadota bacterium]
MTEAGSSFDLASYCLAPGAPDDAALAVVEADGGAITLDRAALRAAVNRLARALACRAGKGERVVLRMANQVAMATAFLATARAGLVAVPVSPQLRRPEVEAILEDADASLIVTLTADDPVLTGLQVPVVQPDDLEGTAALPVVGADDPALLIFTSGTSGRAKGVLHGHHTVLGRRPIRDAWLGIGPGDRVLHAGTLNWTYTLGVGLMDPLAAGATAVLAGADVEPGAWPTLIADHGITVFAAVPTVYRRMLKYGDPSVLRTGPLRHGVTAGEALSPHLWQAWRDATGLELYEALGMTEISTYVSSGPGTPTRPGSAGKAQPGRRIAILDAATHRPLDAAGETGLLAVHRSDPGLMLGYWRRPDEEAAVMFGEWFAGGDLAHLDEDGYVYFHGRDDDVLNALGVRTSPLEIERVLAEHPAVNEVAVTTTANAEGVELITAFVVPAADVDDSDLLAFASHRLAAYKLPKRVVRVDGLPRTANGKVQRRQLRIDGG